MASKKQAPLLSLIEAARHAGLTPAEVLGLVYAGHLTSRTDGAQTPRFDRDELERALVRAAEGRRED